MICVLIDMTIPQGEDTDWVTVDLKYPDASDNDWVGVFSPGRLK